MLDKKIRMIGLDLDGTVFNNSKEITGPVRKAIEAACEQGVVVLPATGRPVLGLPEAFIRIPGIRYALTSNGAAVVDLKDGRRLYEDCIEIRLASQIAADMLTFNGLAEVYMDGRGYADMKMFEKAMAYTSLSRPLVEYIRKSRILLEDMPSFILEHQQPVEKLHMIFEDMDERRRAFEFFREKYPELTITQATDFNIEINSPTCNKGSGLLALGELLGISREEIMACGDSGNDYPMLCAVGLAVAMGNGEDSIKAVSDYVTKSNEEDGVAWAIKKFVLD